jgi:hypothetical protein
MTSPGWLNVRIGIMDSPQRRRRYLEIRRGAFIATVLTVALWFMVYLAVHSVLR